MKVAVLCMAHEITPNLELMINSLSPGFDFYIHFDKKMGKMEKDNFPKNVFIIENRVKVFWSDYSQIQAMYNLLQESYSDNYSHYLFISGADFPLKSGSDILSFFEKNKGVSFIEYSPLPKKEWSFVGGGHERYDKYWITQVNNRKIVSGLGIVLLRLQRLLRVKRNAFPINYYGGSNWSNLSKEAVGYILNYIEKNPAFMKKMRFTFQIDELWIQSILKTSSLDLVNNELRYTDWKTGPEFPKTLDTTDFEKLKKSDALFARKMKGFDLTLQEEILKYIH